MIPKYGKRSRYVQIQYMPQIDPKIIRQIFILLLVLGLGCLIFKAMLPYLSGILGAITLYVLLRKPMAKLVKRGWHPDAAVALLLFLSFVCILLPTAGMLLLLGAKIGKTVNNSEEVANAVMDKLKQLEQSVGLDLSSHIDTSATTTWISDNLASFLGGTFNMTIAVAIMYFLLYYMLTNRRQLKETLYEYIPASTENINMVAKEIRQMVKSNALGIPLVALAQGIVALIGFLIFGIENPFFWAVMVTIGSMIPFVGNLLGTVPAFALTLSQGDTFAAWGILIYGMVVVGSTDNLIRLFVLRKLDNVHPLITLIGVIVGIPLFGFIGLIFGPLLVSLFLIVVRIYKKEYGTRSAQKL